MPNHSMKHDMTIVAHRLVGSRVKHCGTPHTSTRLIDPQFIVLHYTAVRRWNIMQTALLPVANELWPKRAEKEPHDQD